MKRIRRNAGEYSSTHPNLLPCTTTTLLRHIRNRVDSFCRSAFRASIPCSLRDSSTEAADHRRGSRTGASRSCAGCCPRWPVPGPISYPSACAGCLGIIGADGFVVDETPCGQRRIDHGVSIGRRRVRPARNRPAASPREPGRAGSPTRSASSNTPTIPPRHASREAFDPNDSPRCLRETHSPRPDRGPDSGVGSLRYREWARAHSFAAANSARSTH